MVGGLMDGSHNASDRPASLRKRARRWLRDRVAEKMRVQGDLQIWWTPELRIVYVSNPKSGCSTIKNSLKQVQALSYEKSGKPFRRHHEPHLSDDCLRNSGLPIHSSLPRLVISSVRNPYTRALSGYLDMVEGRDTKQYPELKRWTVDTFEDHLAHVAAHRTQTLNTHFRPQHINLDVPRIRYDAIVFLENLAELPELIKAAARNLQVETFSPHARGASSKMKLHYTARSVDLVRQVYAKDFELFGYSQDISDAAFAPGAYIGIRGLVPKGEERVPVSPAAGVTPLVPTLRFQRLRQWRLL